MQKWIINGGFGGFWGGRGGGGGVMDHQRLTVKEVTRELFMDRDSKEEPDRSDNDSGSSFVPKEENSDSDGGDADRPSCSYLLKKFLYHPY